MAEPLVVQLAEGFRTQLAKRDASALQAMSSQWGKVEAALSAAINNLSQELADLKTKGEDIPQWKLFQMERYQSLLAQIGAEMAKYSQYAITQLKDETEKSQRLAQAHAKMMLAGITDGRSLKTALDKLPVEAVESITAIAQAGQPLNKLLQAAYPTAVAGLTNELIYGLSIGRNPRETARAMMKQGLSQGLNHILLVARDQQIRHYREMTRLQYGRNEAIYGYMRLAARNTRTCLACIALDGSIYPTDAFMELHPQDRCSLIPLVEGFPLPQWQRGLDWFKTLPDEEKRRMMGNGRFEAYKEGLFSLDQLVTVKSNPVWGPSAQVTSLAELLKGRGGGAPPLDPAALLATHQSKAKPQKPKTLAVDNKDKALLEALTNELDKSTKLDIATRKAMKDTLAKILSGQKGYVYTDENGRLSGVLSYAPSKSNLQYLNITGAGFVDAAANRRAIVDIAQTAQQHKQGVELYVPNHLQSLYKGWGFLMHQSFQGGARMHLLPDDVPGFLKNPDTFGEQKTAELTAKAKSALLDPQASFTFRVGQEIEGLGFKPINMAEADFAKQTKPLVYEPPLGNLPADKHAAAGMLLFTPDGKLVLVDPANQYGGYKTTFPKGTQEEGMSLQETAVKEVWEESGFKAKILGHLGDYEKTTSVTRFYVGVVEEGAPWAAHYETEAVRIVPFNQADKYLNVGTDKHILSDLRKLHKDIFGSDAFSVAKLEAGLDERAAQKAAEAAPPPAPPTQKTVPPPPPAPAAEPLAAWTKYSIDGLGQLSPTEAKLALEFAQDKPHLLLADEKQALETVASPQTAVSAPKLPPPPGGPPAALSKKALVDHLAKIRGIAKWKLSVMTKEQVAALFKMPEADALAAIEAGGAAHTAKYAGGKKTAVPAPQPAAPSPLAAYQKFQAGDTAVLSAEETLAALEYAKSQGYSVVIKDKLKEAYQEKIGNPLIKTKAGTKAAMVTALNQETGVPIYLLNQLNKAQLLDLVGQPMSLAYAAVGKPFVAKAGQQAAISGQQSAKEPLAPPSVPLPPQPSWPDDLAKAGSQAIAQLAKNAEAIFPPGSPAGKGVAKALSNIQSGSYSGFAYLDGQGQVEGVVAFSTEYGQVKVSGAAFGNTAVNLTAMADVANKALAEGKSLKTFAPKNLIGQYKKWGFEEQDDVGNGSYMLITPDKIPGLVTAAGKVVAKAPEKPLAVSSQPSTVSHQPSSKAPIGLPGGATTQYDAAKLPKEQLVTYMVGATGLTADQVEKFSKLELVKFMKLTPQQAVAAMQSAKFVETTPTAQTVPAPKPTPPKLKERPLPANLPKFQLPDPPGFPAIVKTLKEVRGLGGSTGAKLVQDPATGKQYVMKKGKSAAHLLEEAYADAAYQAAGFNVPTYKVYETAEGPVKLAEFRKGKTLEEFMKGASPADRQKVLSKLRQGFAMDALMGNWDVVGASLDNVLVDDEGEIWRIDNGGSLRYRAQGDKKEKEFLTDYPVELWTMRDKNVGPKNAQMFGQLGIYEIMEQAREMVGKGEAILGALPEELRPMVNGRLAVMRDLVNTSDTLKTDTFQEGYTDGFLKHSTYIRREGIIDRLPQRLTKQKKGGVKVYDENGREFDDLRGEDSIIKQVSAYINANGGNSGAIQFWMNQQGNSSWSSGAQAFKYWMVKQRGGNFDKNFWLEGIDSAKAAYKAAVDVVGEEAYSRTRMMWHAFVYESLRQVEFVGKTADGYIQLMRTEPDKVAKINNLKPGQRNVVIQRGACESASIYKTVKVAGGHLTLQKVPIHRIIGYYFSERPGTDGTSPFLGDGENEFVFMPDDIPFDYYGKVDASLPAEDFWQWQGQPLK